MHLGWISLPDILGLEVRTSYLCAELNITSACLPRSLILKVSKKRMGEVDHVYKDHLQQLEAKASRQLSTFLLMEASSYSSIGSTISLHSRTHTLLLLSPGEPSPSSLYCSRSIPPNYSPLRSLNSSTSPPLSTSIGISKVRYNKAFRSFGRAQVGRGGLLVSLDKINEDQGAGALQSRGKAPAKQLA